MRKPKRRLKALALLLLGLLSALSACRGEMTVIEYGEPLPTPTPKPSATPRP